MKYALPKTALLCFASLCFGCSDTKQDGVVYNLVPYCSNQELTIEKWVKEAPIIFVGKATEVKVQLAGQKFMANSCWAKFLVNEPLKGSIEPNMWVKTLYEPYKKDFKNKDNCLIEQNKLYLIFAFQGKSKLLPEAENHLVVAAVGNYSCTPVILLPDANNNPELAEVRTILKSGR